MKILITGSAGFIGWKVAERALNDGHTVVGVDNLCDSYDVRLKKWRLEQLSNSDQGHFAFYHADISDLTALENVFRKEHGLDAVINLAARAGVRQSVKNPHIYYATNVTGVLNLLDLCTRYGIGKFVQASTSSLYGAGIEQPFREDAKTDNVLSPYAASKKAAEVLCYTYHYLYHLDISVLRYFTVFGPAGRPDMSYFRFIQWIAEEKPLTVFGDGEQKRDFTFVDDIADGTIRALKPLGYEIINLGSNHPISLKHMIELLEDLIGKKARIVHKTEHPADVRSTWADISKAERLLGWKPRVNFEDGLAIAVRWYTENRHWTRDIKTNL